MGGMQEEGEKKPKQLSKYTLAQLQSSADLLSIDSNVYDISEFSKIHPGGTVIRQFGGHEATAAYYSIHYTHSKPSRVLEKYLVGTIEDRSPEGCYDLHSPFGIEVRQAVQEKLNQLPWKSWGPPWVYLRTFIILAFAISLDFSFWFHGPSFLKATVLALSFAFIGLNIQHDANHGAFSKRPWINRALGYCQDYIGGSRMLWIRQHVVGHHPNTSHESLDPDVVSGFPLLVLHSKFSPLKSEIHALQHLYVWILLCFLGLGWLIVDIKSAWNMKLGGWAEVNKRMHKEKYFSIFGKVMFIVRFFGGAWYHCGSVLVAFAYLLYILALGGGYLGFFFLMSHNFEGAIHVEKQESTCWYKAQVESSSNVGGLALLILNGGLNYQIEHHLFPRVSSAHYHLIAPTVKQICQKHNVKYQHFPSIWENFQSTVSFLHIMGSEIAAKKSK